MMSIRSVATVGILFGALAAGWSQAPRLDYEIGIRDLDQHLFRVSIRASGLRGDTLDISMPAWAPGWYVIKPYAGNVSRLQATAGGKPLAMNAVDKQTWRIQTKGSANLLIEYDYFANNRQVNGASLSRQGGYFLGSSLLFYVPGFTTQTPTTIKFSVPEDWQVATPLPPTDRAKTYSARSFDQLVDAPVVMGRFDRFSAEREGVAFHLISDPAGQLNEPYARRLLDGIGQVAKQQGEIFGEIPFKDYWVMFICGTPQVFNGLEHENSTNIVVEEFPADFASAMAMISHEMFHAWNVKRLRPKSLMPYDYRRDMTTTELWFAEGFTSYYGDLLLARTGLISPTAYFGGLGRKMLAEDQSPPSKWVSLTNSSAITWLGYDGTDPGFTTFAADYYRRGELVALMMDLQIRKQTSNAKSLDDVMRLLYQTKSAGGYTNEDILASASTVSGTDFRGFFDQYIFGTAPLPFDEPLALVGLRRRGDSVTDLATVTASQRRSRQLWLQR